MTLTEVAMFVLRSLPCTCDSGDMVFLLVDGLVWPRMQDAFAARASAAAVSRKAPAS